MRTTYVLVLLALTACSSDPPATPSDTGVVTDNAAPTDNSTPTDTSTPDVAPTDVTPTDVNRTDVTPTDASVDATADATPTDATPTDATPADASVDAAPADASAFMALAPCNAATDYVPPGVAPTVVTFGGAVGNTFSPSCVLVHRGAMVTFSGAFSGHPLRASTRGTSGNPIPSTDTGSSVAVTFPALGFFPFYCNFHGTNAGDAMSGVVQVVE